MEYTSLHGHPNRSYQKGSLPDAGMSNNYNLGSSTKAKKAQ